MYLAKLLFCVCVWGGGSEFSRNIGLFPAFNFIAMVNPSHTKLNQQVRL